MNAEQKFFLKTLENHIREEKTSVPDSIDLELVKNYAQSHQLEPIFYYQTGNALFREAYYAQIVMYDIRASVADELFGFLSDIPFFILKGIKVAKFYPVKELRTMGDIDIITKRNELFNLRNNTYIIIKKCREKHPSASEFFKSIN